jgi:hypothetical protein
MFKLSVSTVVASTLPVRVPINVVAVTTPTTLILVAAIPTRLIILFPDKSKLSPEAISWS